ncbi:molybdopterin-dependent oxidoreductase [Candidatus Villigracilis affinis]|uniref:molybdopterin-dependent oxidoreductase n=1 Tax=Candidatus Villigracilis affinis TaxID=3140682 RepID=UPI0031EB615F
MQKDFKTIPWTIEVGGLVNKTKTCGIEDLLENLHAKRNTFYRLRCVEAWSMVIPWTGFTLASLLQW